MKIHEKQISKSIDLNIIGTANLVKEVSKLGIKMIYLSTSYVYPGTKGNYKETDPIKPWNNYSWSKLGGECSVQMYKNSLIIRLCMTEKPFIHNRAYANVKLNFMFQEDAAKLILKIIGKKGIINLGGPSQTVYNFAKKFNKKIKKIYSRGEFPKKIDMNLSKLKNLTNDYKKTKFKDLLIVKQKNRSDIRGNLRETFNNKILKKKFVFEYCTTSKKCFKRVPLSNKT